MPPENTSATRLSSYVFYLLLATTIVVPLVFWPSPFFALESIKTLVIGVMTTIAALLLVILAIREKKLQLPPKIITRTSLACILSLVLSAVTSHHFIKSFFGQGFELGAALFLITLFVAGWVAFSVMVRRADRAIMIYTALVATFLCIWIVHIVRLIGGAGFFTLGFLNSVTASIVGNWFSFGIYAVVIAIVSLSALLLLSLSSRMKAWYWGLFAVAALTTCIVSGIQIWSGVLGVSLILTGYLFHEKARGEGSFVQRFIRRMPWIPATVFVAALVCTFYGPAILGNVITKIGAGYSEYSLPWQLTLDVASGQLKETPLLGSGPNRFTQSYLSHKPPVINNTEAWPIEFNSGFGLIPTSLATQGIIGFIAWIVFFVSLGVLGYRSLRGLMKSDSLASIGEGERVYARFVIISSFTATIFLWYMTLVYVPAHAILYLTVTMTGLWLGTSVYYGRLQPNVIDGSQNLPRHKVILGIQVIVALVVVLACVTYIKNAVAIACFGRGVQEISVVGKIDPVKADKHFATALFLNPLDIYWQGRSEASLVLANQIIASVTATTSASVSAEAAKKSADLVNQAMIYANNAVASDPDKYDNYISQTRVGELATALRMPNGYENAVRAYASAIAHNQGNPVLYLNLARLHASQTQYDKAIQALGAALQVKNNYLDAVYLLSQVQAAKGDLNNALVAADFATQLNPQNPLLFFQVGLLSYSKGDYQKAIDAFNTAVRLQPNYANAQYFLGLSYARLDKTAEALRIFMTLSDNNPTNTDLTSIVSTLRAGKSLFTSPTTVSAARPEKRSSLPIKER